MRSDGVPAQDSSCTGTKPNLVQTTYETSGCGYSWTTGDWQEPTASCGASSQTRTVSCLRSDGQTVPAAACAGVEGKPASSQPVTDYKACTYDWSVGAYSGPSTTCGDATQTRSVFCERSDGSHVNDDRCSTQKPDSTQSSYRTDGCTFAWQYGGWSAPAAACGPSTQTRKVSCVRSDGQPASDGSCVAADKPATSISVNNYDTCSYQWSVGAWNGSTQCGATVTQTRDVHCERSNGDKVFDSQCASQGTKPAATQPITDYTGCSYAWKTAPGTWSSTCSATATQSNNVTCRRSDGSTVAESMCDGATRPADTNTGNYASCTYTGTYAASGTCTGATGPGAGTQPTTITKCTRSDGVDVPAGNCSRTSTQSCTVEITSTQYAREAAAVRDASGYQIPNAFQNPDAQASRLNLIAPSTLCWDSVNNTTATTDKCSQLTRGVNVYDTLSLPATFVPTLREIYVDRNDMQALAPHATTFVSGQTLTNMCNGATVAVGDAKSNASWTLRCGAPDNPAYYAREVNTLRDPANYDLYPNQIGGTFSLYSSSTLCWNSSTASIATSTKCQYLPGANVGDVSAIPAKYVKDLREVYVDRNDVQAIAPHSNSLFSQPFNNACNGAGVSVGPKGATESWIFYCGAADSADHYAREAGSIRDPADVSRYLNANVTAKSINLRTNTTQCWDKTSSSVASPRKCQYLGTGSNVDDISTIPATFVPDLREIYVDRNDLQAVAPHANSFFSQTLTNACNGASMSVGPQGATNSWTMRCGTPDTADHYQRETSTLRDPANYEPSVNTSPTGTTLRLRINGTLCYDTTTNSSVSGTKCAYLPTGKNVGDNETIAATYVPELREVYVNRNDVQALAPRGSNFLGYSLSSMCGGASIQIGAPGATTTWTLRCGTADTYDHYRSYAVILGDPKLYVTGDNSKSNDTATPTLYTRARTTSCYDTTAKADASSTKCAYLPSGSGPTLNSLVAVPAVWNTTGTRTVTLKKSDLTAIFPYTTQYLNSMCGLSYSATTGGVAASYTVVCQ